MPVYATPGTSCNLACSYCYEEADRDLDDGSEIPTERYDIDAILDRLKEMSEVSPNMNPGLHGGEPLLLSNADMELLFEKMYEFWDLEESDDNPTIQTNGTLLTDDHIRIFKKYDVGVGVSCDGPPELNVEREARMGEKDVTDKGSEKTMDAIERLIESDVGVGVITVLHKTNAGTDERLEKLHDWMDWLNRNGASGHFNPAIPYEDIQTDISLSAERTAEVYVQTYEWMMEEPYREWDPMYKMTDNLMMNNLGNCVNQKCDVYNAGAARIVKGNGETSGCGKTWSAVGDGTAFLQGPSNDTEYDDSEERYEMLKQVPGPYTEGEEDMGGCKGCPYWGVCHGGCPSHGLDGDFRNRTKMCEAKRKLYEAIENRIRTTMPNMLLTTDFPWHLETNDLVRHGVTDLGAFDAVETGDGSYSSVYRGAPKNAIVADVISELTESDEVEHIDFDDRVKLYEELAGEDNVTSNRETGSIHMDSATTETDEGYEYDPDTDRDDVEVVELGGGDE